MCVAVGDAESPLKAGASPLSPNPGPSRGNRRPLQRGTDSGLFGSFPFSLIQCPSWVGSWARWGCVAPSNLDPNRGPQPTWAGRTSIRPMPSRFFVSCRRTKRPVPPWALGGGVGRIRDGTHAHMHTRTCRRDLAGGLGSRRSRRSRHLLALWDRLQGSLSGGASWPPGESIPRQPRSLRGLAGLVGGARGRFPLTDWTRPFCPTHRSNPLTKFQPNPPSKPRTHTPQT